MNSLGTKRYINAHQKVRLTAFIIETDILNRAIFLFERYCVNEVIMLVSIQFQSSTCYGERIMDNQ